MAKYLGIPLQVANGTSVTPTYGSQEYVENGDFLNGATDWNVTAGGWASAPVSGVWSCDGTQTGNTNLAQAGVFSGLLGKKVLISFKVETYTAGNVKFLTGDSSIVGTPKASTGISNTVAIVTNNATGLNIQADEDFIGSVSIVSVKEVPFVLGKEQVVNGDFSSETNWTLQSAWSIRNNKALYDDSAEQYIVQNGLSVSAGKTYQVSFDISDSPTSSVIKVLFGTGFVISPKTTRPNGSYVVTFTPSTNQSNLTFLGYVDGDVFSLSNVSLKEVQYNYLQKANGDFLKQCKVGDVVFNLADDTEAVVLKVISNDVLLLSNDILSDAGDQFFIYAPNGDTRGNQLLRVDNYIISEYDENVSVRSQSSFWFAAGPQADKVTLQQLNNAVNTYFVADVIERFVQRLNAQSATASRLDIPLNEFRDHKYNQVLATTFIILS